MSTLVPSDSDTSVRRWAQSQWCHTYLSMVLNHKMSNANQIGISNVPKLVHMLVVSVTMPKPTTSDHMTKYLTSYYYHSYHISFFSFFIKNIQFCYKKKKLQYKSCILIQIYYIQVIQFYLSQKITLKTSKSNFSVKLLSAGRSYNIS